MSLQGVIFLRIWSFDFFRFFTNFNLIFNDFISYFKSQKRGSFSTGPTEDTWRAELRWCAGPARMRRGTQGHVAELRKPTWHASDAQVARTRGRGHASPRGRPGGTTWHEGGWQVKGPWVIEPWLDSWGGNAIALNRPAFYTHCFLSFSPCGTMFLFYFEISGYVAASRALDPIASCIAHRSCGPQSTESSSHTRD